MIYGNASWGFRETPLEEQLKITAGMGLSLLELGIAGHENDYLQLDATEEQLNQVKEWFDKYGITLMCASTGNDFTQESYEDCLTSLNNVTKVIDICAKLNIKYLRIFAGFSPVKDVIGKRWDAMIECLNRVGEYAKNAGVIPVIETHGGVDGFDDGVVHFYSTSSELDTLKKMLSELNSYLKVNFDPANLYAVGIEHPETVYKAVRDRIEYVHLKDFVKLPATGHLLPAACGESDMDWKSLMSALADFDGPALIEYENTEDIEDGCRRSLEFLKTLA